MLRLFLSRLDSPVCLVAHNGFEYDYPLLAAELTRVGRTLPDTVLCTDSLLALRDLDGVPLYPYGKPRYSPSPIRPLQDSPSPPSTDDNNTAKSTEPTEGGKPAETAGTGNVATECVQPETPLIKCTEENNNTKNPLTSTPKSSGEELVRTTEESPVLSVSEDDSGIVSGDLTATGSDISIAMATPKHPSKNLPNREAGGVLPSDPSDKGRSGGVQCTKPSEKLSADQAPVTQSVESEGFELSECEHPPDDSGLSSSLESHDPSLSLPAEGGDGDAGDAGSIPPVGPAVCSFQSPMRAEQAARQRENEMTPKVTHKSQSDDPRALLVEANPQEIRSVKRKLFPDDSDVVVKKSLHVSSSEVSGKESLGVSPLAPSEESSRVALAHWMLDTALTQQTAGTAAQTAETTTVQQSADKRSTCSTEQTSGAEQTGHCDPSTPAKTPLKAQATGDLWAAYEEEDSISDEDMLMCTSPLVSSAPSTPGTTSDLRSLEAKLRCSSSSFSSNGSSGPGSAEKMPSRTRVDTSLESSSLNVSTSSTISSSTVTTPKQSSSAQSQVSATPHRLRVSYKLEEVYKRVCGVAPAVSHCAEDDCLSLLRICHRMAPRILLWMDRQAVPFSQNSCMYEVKKVSYLQPGQFPYQL